MDIDFRCCEVIQPKLAARERRVIRRVCVPDHSPLSSIDLPAI